VATQGPSHFADCLQLCRRAHDHHTTMSINYLIWILCLVLWIAAIVDCAKSSNPNKVVWIIVILLLPFLGSLLYFLFGKSRS
jgi:hypothetical protein